MNKLIIAEKPSVAIRIAMSLGDAKPRSESANGIRYFVIQKGQDQIFVVAAAGHLFTLKQSAPDQTPVFEIEWVASYKVNQSSYFTKKYLDAIESVGRHCSFFINACDYDIEGTVIGTNIIKQVVNKNVNSEIPTENVMRMRFSTTTTADLVKAYENLEAFDRLNYDAGEARHKLDWMWGINLSRALMSAIASKGLRKTLSIGRVQGPTLGILAKREAEIRAFVPRPYWKVVITAKGIGFEAKDKETFEKDAADKKLDTARKGPVSVASVESEERSMRPFPPFDLTSLQLEASRVFRIDPSRTLAVAQALYERSYISYPRTSSQKLPQTLNLQRIISSMARQQAYAETAQKLMAQSRYRPAEGSKDDEAHPAIHPTGEEPKSLGEEESKIYDLISRRFLACFADYSKSEITRVRLLAGTDEYAASGERMISKGWIEEYRYFKPKELQMPQFKQGEAVIPDSVELKSLKTLPPKRFSKASLISLLESKDLGTKATRAEIIDTLFRRDYIKGSSIEVTEFGLSIYNALSAYCPNILSEQLTKKLESDMERIQKGERRKAEVINEGKSIITELVSEFRGKEQQIGEELMKGLKGSENSSLIGICKVDGGNLVLRRSKAGKTFIGCANYPKCTNTYSVPQNAKIVATGKVCELCHTPKIKVFRKGRRPFEMDLDPSCETKKAWASAEGKQPEVKTALELGKAAQHVDATQPPAASKPANIGKAKAHVKQRKPAASRKGKAAKKAKGTEKAAQAEAKV